MLRHLAPAAAPARGITIVETMVGLAVGMVLLTGALSLFVDNLTHSRRLLSEARLTQDLRAAADLVARDLRRAGYWGHAIQGTHALGAGSTVPQNPYAVVSGSSADGLSYGFSRDGEENDALDAGEQFGFRIHDGALQMQTAQGTWQDVTDVGTMVLTDQGLQITAEETALPLGHLCPKVCNPGVPNCPASQVRTYTLVLTGRSVRDPAVQRQFTSAVRVRNDRLSGQCPK